MIDLKYVNWSVKIDADRIVWLSINVQDRSANILTKQALDELEKITENLSENRQEYDGIIIDSKKSTGFILGADIINFVNYSKDDIEKLLIQGQRIFYRLEKLSNTVCLIDGFCLGGGLELALACDYRVISKESKLGLPEVTLGILPGWGGTVRLPRLVGSFHALNMMITGKPIKSMKCKKIGLVDEVVSCRQLKNAGRWFVKNKPKLRKLPIYEKIFSIKFIRDLYHEIVCKKVKKKVNKKHYPAPYKIIKNWSLSLRKTKILYENERRTFLQLIDGSYTAKNLIRVYQLQQKLKKYAINKTEVKHIHVVGTGIMGSEIAAYCALKGFKVTFSDTQLNTLGRLMKMANKIFCFRLKGAKLERAFDRLIPDYNAYGLQSADLIIEAVSEDLEIKRAVWKDINNKASNTAILATNTSSLPLSSISNMLDDPKRLIGIHFFNPVSRMPLVEVIFENNRDSSCFAEALNFVRVLGKLPLPVKSSPGFLVNRILMPYIVEAFIILEEGDISKETIDYTMKQYGMPMGPIELADVVGLDICLSVGKKLQDSLGIEIPSKIQKLVSAGNLGKKTGRGLYEYSNGKMINSLAKSNLKYRVDVRDRLISKMEIEANECLRDSIVEDKDMIDAGMIFGTGFAPFRGGLLHQKNP
ncbi:MAG: enoyl-CoA hydratase/isomerase family protein [Legionellales bacterium]|nr:enoyl-CoA hydratase/isomerase family protein [Legionellales bacterium]